MTVPPRSPACPQEPSPQGGPAGDSGKRTKKLYVYWAVALTLLIGLGLFCWLVVVPVMETGAIVESWDAGKIDADTAVKRLGDPEEAVGRLVRYYRFPGRKRQNRLAAARIMSWYGKSALAATPMLSKDEYWGVRSAAAQALGRCGREGVQLLITMSEDTDIVVRIRVLENLAKIRDSRVRAPLIAGLRDEYDDVRVAAATQLGIIGEPWVVPNLVAALSDPDFIVREAAAKGLGKAGDASVVSSLESALKDEDLSVRQAAAEALERIRGVEEK